MPEPPGGDMRSELSSPCVPSNQEGEIMFRIRVGLAACGVALAAMLSLAGGARAQNELKSPTMDAIKQRGQLICGIDTGIPGYAFQDSKGVWQGLDVSYCRAIADALLGSPSKVKYIGLT